MVAVIDEGLVRVDQYTSYADVDRARAKVQEANKKAARAKLGEPFSLTVSRKMVTENVNGLTRSYPVWTVRVLVDGPDSLGYDFAATLAWVEGNATVRTTPVPSAALAARLEEGALPVPSDKRCDHCGTIRNRKDTYLVFDPTTGEFSQVGANCLVAYTGIPVGWPGALDGLSDEALAGCYAAPTTVDVSDVLLMATQVMAAYGFTSRAQAEAKQVPSTTDLLGEHLLFSRPLDKRDHKGQEERATILAAIPDEKLAEGALEWARNLSDREAMRSDYMGNIRTLARAERVEVRHLGTLVSIVGVHKRNLEKVALKAAEEAARPAATKSRPVVGAKVTVSGKVLMTKEIYGHYGVSVLVMVDDQAYAEKFKTFSSASWSKDVKAGDEVTISGTVKSHDQYEGRTSVGLTRCRRVG